MKYLLLFIILLYFNFQSLSQSTFSFVNGDSISSISKVYQNQKRIFVFINSRSCTGCKDNLNRFFDKIDTAKCRIIIVRGIPNNSNLLKREVRSEINNYFSKYNLLLFELSYDNVPTPNLILLDEHGVKKRIEYYDMFDGTSLSSRTIDLLTKFIR